TVMASPDHDVSRRGGDVSPHRHLEDQTDHLLFFCHLSSPVAKHYSHASWSLRSPCGICCFAPNICSSLPELCGMSCRASCDGRNSGDTPGAADQPVNSSRRADNGADRYGHRPFFGLRSSASVAAIERHLKQVAGVSTANRAFGYCVSLLGVG